MIGRNIVVLVSLLALSAACGGSTDSTGEGSTTPQGAGGSGVSGAAGSSAAGGSAGSGQAGSGVAGSGVAGSGQAGSGQAGSGQAGSGQAGSGQAGSGQAGSGQAGSGPYNPCENKVCGQVCDPCPPNADCNLKPGYCSLEGQCLSNVTKCGGGECNIDSDCPQFDNGTQGYCVGGQCIYKPLDPCFGLPCGAKCNSCFPGEPCPDVELYCDVTGQCQGSVPQCGGLECKVPEQCPVPDAPCKQCPDGSLSCPEATCENNVCGVKYQACGQLECKLPEECPQPKAPCQPCPDGGLSCPQATCVNGQCGVEYTGCQGGQDCKVPEQCPVPDSCQLCADGSLSCAQPTCENNKCGYYYPPCKAQCQQAQDCPIPSCDLCPDGSSSCPSVSCQQGQCVYEGGGCSDVCAPVQVKADPGCKQQLGFYWDGASCQPLNGCQCFGECDKVQATYDECKALHGNCGGPDPQCKQDFDCPQPGGPCQLCPDGTTACPSVKCLSGQCVLESVQCQAPSCAAMEAFGVGDCKKLLGFAWNGKDCTSITGCDCKGNDCGALTGSYDECILAHQSCTEVSPCSGKLCGDFCSNCTGDICPPVIEYCNIDGKCTTESPVCAFP